MVLHNCLPWDQDARRPRRRLSPLSEKQQLPQKQGATSSQLSWFKTPLEQMVNGLFLISSLKENGDPWGNSPRFRLPAHPFAPPLLSFKGEVCGLPLFSLWSCQSITVVGVGG